MKNRRILIVDDDPNVRDLLIRALERIGYTVFLAASAEGAMDILASHAVDGVVIDLHMPAMSGRTLVRLIQNQWPALAHRIAVMTEDPDAATDACVQQSRLPVVTKPFRLVELRRVVEAITADERQEANGA